jgi:hypothetical protein
MPAETQLNIKLLSKSQAVTKYLSLFYKDGKLTSTGREYLARLRKFDSDPLSNANSLRQKNKV